MTTTANPVDLRTDSVDLPAAEPSAPRRSGLLRGRTGDPRWVRPALLGLLATTAVLYLWALGRSGWANEYYSAAVQAGTRSWKAMFFGSFDASNAITVDKTPAFLWVMEVSARIFGLSSWSVLVPQALEGVATVGVLYLAVRRWAGPAAGLLAGALLALTPVAALMFRFNNPDALLVLLLTLGAYAMVRAVDSGRTAWILAAGAFVGVGFLAKMLQAVLVLPAFALVYLVAGPPRLGRRVRQTLLGGLAAVLAAGWWVAIVELWPASARPYIGGSSTNSILQLAFGYNGLGRITGNETGSVGFGNGTGPAFGGAPRWDRLFGTQMGGQISWLIPAAVIALLVGLVLTARRPRVDRERAGYLLWGGMFAVTAVVLSYASGIIHPYYTVALGPPVAALVAIGAVSGWQARDRWTGRLTLAAMVAATAVWSYALLDRTPTWLPWLRVVVLAGGLGAAVGLPLLPWLPRLIAPGLAVAALVVGVAGPFAYTMQTVRTPQTGALPSAGPTVAGSFGGFPGPGGTAPSFPNGFPGFPGFGGPGGAGGPGTAAGGAGGPGTAAGRPGGGGLGGLGGGSTVDSALVSLLRDGGSGYSWAAATVGASSAAPLQLASGQPIMAIGGFNGTDAVPTLAQFQAYVAAGRIHYFVVGGGFAAGGGFGGPGGGGGGGASTSAQISSWVPQHYSSSTVGGMTVYDLTKPSSTGASSTPGTAST